MVGAAAAALDVGLAVDQRDRRRVPARPVHVALARERVVGPVEQVAVVVARVRGRGAGPVVAARDEDRGARAGQQHLRAAEDVGAGAVGQREVACVGRADAVPHVIDEVAGLLAGRVGSVGEDPAVGHEHRMHRDQRPAVDLRPHAAHVGVGGNRGAGRDGQRLRAPVRCRCRVGTARVALAAAAAGGQEQGKQRCAHGAPCDVLHWGLPPAERDSS